MATIPSGQIQQIDASPTSSRPRDGRSGGEREAPLRTHAGASRPRAQPRGNPGDALRTGVHPGQPASTGE